MAEPARKRATYADVLAAPPNVVAEIIDGVLETHPRPSPRHGLAASALGVRLGEAYQFGSAGGGGWIFIDEPEFHLSSNILAPDIAGWRRERLSRLLDASYIDIVPDWICEVLSASTERCDRGAKRRIYAEAGVGHLWLLDPRFQLLEVFTLVERQWVLVGTWGSDDVVSAPPFDAITISLADLWPLDRPLGFEENPQHLFSGDR